MNKTFSQLQPLIHALQRYSVTAAIIAVGSVYAYLIYTSSNLVQIEPSETEISDKYQSAKRPKIDDAIINKLNDLQDHNITFQGLIDEARNNPFAE